MTVAMGVRHAEPSHAPCAPLRAEPSHAPRPAVPCAMRPAAPSYAYCANRQSPVEGRRYSRGVFRLPRAAGRFAAEVR